MKSLFTIEMDFRKAKSQANELDSLADRLNNLANNDFTSNMDLVKTSWEGAASDQYVKKSEAVYDRMKTSSGDLRKAASAIRTIAENTYRAEMEAYRIAMERTYGGSSH